MGQQGSCLGREDSDGGFRTETPFSLTWPPANFGGQELPNALHATTSIEQFAATTMTYNDDV